MEVIVSASKIRWFMPMSLEGRLAFDVGIPGAVELSCFYAPWGGVEVTWLWVDKPLRGAGMASEMMNKLCRWADRHGQKLWLWAKPFNSPEYRNPYVLAAWYARNFGFEPTRAEVQNRERMIRMVRWPSC